MRTFRGGAPGLCKSTAKIVSDDLKFRQPCFEKACNAIGEAISSRSVKKIWQRVTQLEVSPRYPHSDRNSDCITRLWTEYTTHMSLTFAGVTIESRTSDNFINATQLCKAGGKMFKNWYRLPNTRGLITELNSQTGSYMSQPVVDIITDGPVKLRGSWIHPDLAVQLAQWISPAFALQVSRWIRELYTEGSVQIAASNSTKTDDFKRLEQRNLQLEEELKKRDHLVEYTKTIENELAVHKKRVTRDQTIYIVSTEAYAKKGIFKIGRTRKDMKTRLVGHNVSRIPGDLVTVLAEFKVFDATLLERNIHAKLSGLAVEGEREFFRCPFITLLNLVEIIVRNDDTENVLVDRTVDTVFDILKKKTGSDTWVLGLDTEAHWPRKTDDSAEVHMRLTVSESTAGSCEDDEEVELANFNVTNTSTEDRRAFINACVVAYRRIILKQKEQTDGTTPDRHKFPLIWTAFQPYLKKWLGIRDNDRRYKAMEWKTLAEDVIRMHHSDIDFYKTKGRRPP